MQPSLDIGLDESVIKPWMQLHHCLSDRGSKYSATIGFVHNREEITLFLKRLKKDKAYAKATHNTFAARISKDGVIFEVKRDDGETGAGMIILRELQRSHLTNVICVVTRWYGGVHLNTDRFAHVQTASHMATTEFKNNRA